MTSFSTAPIRVGPMLVESGWGDYNHHMNMAYYAVLFDRAWDHAFEPCGFGPETARQRGISIFTVEAHIRYVRELMLGDEVFVDYTLVELDEKRIRSMAVMTHATEGYVAATFEALTLGADLKTRKVTRFPADMHEKLAALAQAHAGLERPAWLGRGVAMRRG